MELPYKLIRGRISPGFLQVVALFAIFASGQAQDAPRPFNISQPLVACTAYVNPFGICNASITPSEYTGYDVEVFRLAAAGLGLEEGTNYTFRCVPFNVMIDALEAGTGPCDVGMGGITITVARQDLGIKFSYPTYNSGLGTMVRTSSVRTTGWGWVTPFTWDLWLAVGLTVLIFPLFLFLIEFWSLKRRIHKSDLIPGVEAAANRSLRTLLALEPLEVSSMGAKITTLVFLFISLILINSYTANLAASLTVTKIQSQITSVDQLRGRAVETNDIYMPRLRSNYGIQAIQVNPDDPYFVQRAAADIVAGTLSALITDAPVIRAVLAELPGCQVRMLDQVIEPFSYGFAFRNGAPDAGVEAFSEQVLALQENGELTRLADTFKAQPQTNSCGNEVNDSSSSFTFHSVYGLWIILAGSLGIAFIFVIAARVRMRRRRQEQERKGREEAVAGGKRGAGLFGRAWLSRLRRGSSTTGEQPMPPRGRELVHLGSLLEEGKADGGRETARPEVAVAAAEAAAEQNGDQTLAPATSETVHRWQDLVKMSVLQRGQSLFGEETVWRARDDEGSRHQPGRTIVARGTRLDCNRQVRP